MSDGVWSDLAPVVGSEVLLSATAERATREVWSHQPLI